MNGAVFSNHTVNEEFRKRYTTQYKNDYQLPNAGLAYDLAFFVSKLFAAETLNITPEYVLTRLKRSQAQDGVSGRFSYKTSDNGDKYFEFPIVLRQVRESSVVTVAQR